MPIVLNGSGPVTGVTSLNTTVSDTEIGYLDGVTSALQTQINTAGGLVKITDVTFSAQSSVSVNNCFTSTYTNYRIIFDNVFIASGIDIRGRMRLRAGGTDNSTSNYQDGRRGISTGATFDSVFETGKTSFEHILNFSGADRTFCSVDIYAPQIADRTAYTCSAVTFDALQVSAGRFNAATQFDGFTFFPASSTATGTLRVYGYKN